MTTVKVDFGGDEYFDLLAARPEWGAYFALGSRVVFVAEGIAYELVEAGGGPVDIPPTHAPDPTHPAPDNPAPDSGQDQPTVAPVVGSETGNALSGTTLCIGTIVAAATIAALLVLLGAAQWRRGRK